MPATLLSRPVGRQFSKTAALGGQGNDVPFEQAFSNLAHAYLADKAPSLLDHEQGFQLLDRNQENTKAVGVMGFKVGSNQLYAPIFFLQGDLKGHELLYLKNQDLFVPMKENWLNYLLNRKPHILGESTGRNTSQLGILQPDLSRLKTPYKYASAMPEWVQPFVLKFGSLLAAGAFERTLDELETHCRERLNLGEFIKSASLPMLDALVHHCGKYPTVGKQLDESVGFDNLSQAIKSAGLRYRTQSVFDAAQQPAARVSVCTGSVLEKQAAKKTDPNANQKLKVIAYDATRPDSLPEGLTEEDQEKLLADKVLILDERTDEDVSVPYNVQTEKRLFNPSETGLYEILTKPGDFERCLVIIHPHGPHGRKQFATLVRVDDQKNWLNCYTSEIWATSQIEGEDYAKWYDGLPEAKSLDKGKDRHVLVGPRGNGTLPFRVEKSHGKADGETIYEVDFAGYCDRPRHLNGRSGLRPYESEPYYDSYEEYRDGQRIHLDSKDGTDLRSSRGDLWVPKGYKLLKVEQSEADKETKDHDHPVAYCGHSSSRSSTPPIIPGDLIDAELALVTKTAGLKLIHDGCEVFVNGSSPLKPLSALVHLVHDHGFREDVARHMLKQAELRRSLRLRVKYADPYLTEGGPTAPTMQEPDRGGDNPLGFQGQTQSYQEYEQPIPGMDPGSYDQSGYDVRPEATTPQMDQQHIQRAQQSGQREVFDTAMIGSMLKTVRDDTMIDRYLPDLIKGMDRKGRLLFQFYAHGDKFADRYGKQDLPELEDSLRNAFEMDGDVVLYLKQKTVEPYPEQADNVNIDIDDSGNL